MQLLKKYLKPIKEQKHSAISDLKQIKQYYNIVHKTFQVTILGGRAYFEFITSAFKPLLVEYINMTSSEY